MGNIFDYLDWRGDISFANDPFNEIDNLIFSWASYVDLDEIMPSGICDVNVTISEAAIRFFEKYDLQEKLKAHTFSKTSALLFDKMAKCKRFSDVKIINYVNKYSEDSPKQFSCMTFQLASDLIYVAFRGTDDTVVGWREDFNLSFLPFIPSQREAVNYLNQSLAEYKGKIILGGHSKGGNLAVYSGVYCDAELRKNIIAIYNNDGPGFLANVLESQEYKEMLPYIKTIVPESSVVGMLLGHDEEYQIVRSSQRGIFQHDAGTWELIGNHFLYLDTTSSASKFMDHTIRECIESLSEEERMIVIDALFTVVGSTGAKNVGEIYDLGIKNFSTVVKTFSNMSLRTKQVLISVIKSSLDIMSTNLKTKLKG